MSIRENLEKIRENIDRYANRASRNYDDITLIAVTKTQSIEKVNEVIEDGVLNIGENKPQEIRDKLFSLDAKINVHMIGQLQTNKVKYIIDRCKLIHSLDRISLLKEMDKRAKINDVKIHALIQINHTKDPNRGGINIPDLEGFASEISSDENVIVDGLMCVSSITDDEAKIRREFESTRNALEKLKNLRIENIRPSILSMGMSHDYHLAILEGSTHVRIGSAIFGARTRR